MRGTFRAPQGLLVSGSLRLAPGAVLEGPVEVTGEVVLEEDARLTHPLLGHAGMRLGARASTPTCQLAGDVHLGVGAHVEGALRCAALYLEEEGDAKELAERRRMVVRSRGTKA